MLDPWPTDSRHMAVLVSHLFPVRSDAALASLKTLRGVVAGLPSTSPKADRSLAERPTISSLPEITQSREIRCKCKEFLAPCLTRPFS